MLKRANISLAIAVIPGLIAYTGLFDKLVPAANLIFFILFGFAIISFLLCLFDDEAQPRKSVVESPRAKEIVTPALPTVVPLVTPKPAA